MKINENLLSKSDDTNLANANNIIRANEAWSGGIVKVDPDTTYTFSKNGGNRYYLMLFRSKPELGQVLDERLLADIPNGTNENTTFTTTADENWLFFYGDNNYVKPFYKLEIGTEATPWIPHRDDLTETQRALMPEHLFGGGYRVEGDSSDIASKAGWWHD